MLPKRGRFRTRGGRHTPDEVRLCAEQYRRDNLSNPTLGTQATEQMLGRLKLVYEREVIFYTADKKHFCIVDFWLPAQGIVIEVDGGYHKKQPKYDATKDQFLIGNYANKVIRLTNAQVLQNVAATEKALKEAILK